MQKLVTLSAAAVLSVSLFSGAAVSAQNQHDAVRGDVRIGEGSSIRYTGPDSFNEIDVDTELTVECETTNDVTLGTVTEQKSESGDAKVTFNTDVGGIETGEAVNVNDSRFEVAIDNAGELCGDQNKDKDKDKGGDQPPANGGRGGGDRGDDRDDDAAVAAPAGGLGAGPSGGLGAGIAELPETSGVSPAVYAGIAALSVGLSALLTRLGLGAYARFKA